MSDEIIKVLDDLAQRFGVVIDWTAENVLPYLKEIFGKLITYQIAQNSILIGFACLMFIGAIMIATAVFMAKKKCEKERRGNLFFFWNSAYTMAEFDEEFGIPAFAIATIIGLMAIAIFAVNLDDLLRWSIMPEIQVIEWISENIKI